MSDVWTDIGFLSTTHSERTGYIDQKPTKLLDRIVGCSTNPGDLVADLCCGSGTTLVSAQNLGRMFYGCDSNPEAVKISKARLGIETD